MIHKTIRELDEKHSTQECSSIYSNINSEDPEFEEKDLGGGAPHQLLVWCCQHYLHIPCNSQEGTQIRRNIVKTAVS